MVVSDIMEELLSIKCAPQEEREISVGCFDDIRNLVNGFPTIKGIFVREAVFEPVDHRDSVAKCFCYSGKQCWIYDGRFTCP